MSRTRTSTSGAPAPRKRRAPSPKAKTKAKAGTGGAKKTPSKRAARGKGPDATEATTARIWRPLGQLALLGGILSCGFSAVALLTYSAADPSFWHAGTGGTPVQNSAGPIGAWVADGLLQVFGVGAALVPFLGIAFALRLAGRRVGGPVRWMALLTLFWVGLSALALVVSDGPTSSFPLAGLLGSHSAPMLVDLVGPVGVWIVLLGISMVAFTYVGRVDWEQVMNRVVGEAERALPEVGRASARAGRRAMGGVSGARARILERMQEARERAWEPDYTESDDYADTGSIHDTDPSLYERERDDPPSVHAGHAGGVPVTAMDFGAEPDVGPLPVPTALPMEHARGVQAELPRDEVGAPAADLPHHRTQAGVADAPHHRTQAGSRELVEVEWVPTAHPDSTAPDPVHPTPQASAAPAPRPQPAVFDLAELVVDVPDDVFSELDATPDATDAPEPPAFGARPDAVPEPRERARILPEFMEEEPVAPEMAPDAPMASPAAVEAPAILPEPAAPAAAAPAAAAPAAASPAAAMPAAPAAVAPSPARRAAAPPKGRSNIQVDPGALVSGGTNDDGRAVIAHGEDASFELPHLGLLDEHERNVARIDEAELRELGDVLEQKLEDFGVRGEVTAIRPGPVITTFEYLPAAGIKLSKISALEDDIAMALKALRVRIVAPIPGKGVVGFEVPNKRRQTVWIRDLLASEAFRKSKRALPMVLGKSVEGKPELGDLAKAPHLLVAGTTGSGKSVGVNAMLLSMLFTRTPDELKLLLIDPKMLEFELYRDIPHLIHPVVTDPNLANAALKWACQEMDDRYRALARWKTRNIASYNQKVEAELEDWTPAKAWKYAPRDWPHDEPPPPPRKLPYLVIVIDELADLMMIAAKEVETSIARIAQKARAAGIHLIVATQRPEKTVVTGIIKANMPSRMAFQVRSRLDGRIILDQNGAENLLGKGDMLFLPPGVAELVRCHGAFVSDDEVREVCDFLRLQGEPNYEAEIRVEDEDAEELRPEDYDDLYDQAVAYVVGQGKASTSMVQREFKIGYNRAARMIEVMEREGVVGAADGARPRKVLVMQGGGVVG